MCICFGIVHKLLGSRIPLDGAAQVVGNVTQRTYRAGTMPDLHRHHRIGLCLQCVDEVLQMRNFSFVSALSDFYRGRKQALVGSKEMFPRHFNPSFIAPELHALGLLLVERLLGHDHTARIFIGEKLRIFETGRNDLDRAALVHPQSPLGNIEHVGSPVGGETAAQLLVPAPPTPELLVLLGIEGDRRIQL